MRGLGCSRRTDEQKECPSHFGWSSHNSHRGSHIPMEAYHSDWYFDGIDRHIPIMDRRWDAPCRSLWRGEMAMTFKPITYETYGKTETWGVGDGFEGHSHFSSPKRT